MNAKSWVSSHKVVVSLLLLTAVLLAVVPVQVGWQQGGDGVVPKLIGGVPTITIGSASAAGTADYTCDGVQDNVQFQAALNALPATGGRISVLAFNYSFAATVTRAINNITIEGVGLSSYITYNAANAIFSAGAQSGWVFRNFRTDAGGITVAGSTAYTVENVMVTATYMANVYPTSLITTPILSYLGSATNAAIDGPQCVFINGHYAYVHAWDSSDTTKQGIVSVWDISDNTPDLVGSVSSLYLRASSHRMGLWGQYLICCGSTNAEPGWNDTGLAVIDVSNPASPAFVTCLVDAVNLLDCHAVQLDSRGIAWTANSDDNSISAVDINDPTNPILVHRLQDAVNLANPVGLSIQGTLLYVTGNGGGANSLTVVDISDPNAPAVLGMEQDALMADCHDPQIRGKYAYVVGRSASSFVVIDCSDPTNPTMVGSVVDAHNLLGVHALRLVGNYAVVVCFGEDRVTLVDISDPTAPAVHSSITDAVNLDYAVSVDVVGNYAIVVAFNADRVAKVSLGSNDLATARIGSLEVDNLRVNNSAKFLESLTMGTGTLPGHSRTVMFLVPDLVLNLAGVSSVGPANLDLTTYLPEHTVAVILRSEFKDTASAGADVAFVVKYSDTYELQSLSNIAHFRNNTWNTENGTLMVPPSRIMRYQLWASGANTASVKTYLLGYIVQD